MISNYQVDDDLEWFRPLLKPSSDKMIHRVDELLPNGYDVYLRLFHPFQPWNTASKEEVARSQLRSWESLALEANVVYHGELSWKSLETVIPIVGDGRRYATLEGQMVRDTARTLMSALATGSAQQRVLFLYDHPGTNFASPEGLPFAFEGDTADIESVIDAAGYVLGPTYIWPTDRAWLVATDYDLVSTYIACGSGLAQILIETEGIEVLKVSLSSRIDSGCDVINR